MSAPRASAGGPHPAHEDPGPRCRRPGAGWARVLRASTQLCARKRISTRHEKKLVLLLFVQRILPTPTPTPLQKWVTERCRAQHRRASSFRGDALGPPSSACLSPFLLTASLPFSCPLRFPIPARIRTTLGENQQENQRERWNTKLSVLKLPKGSPGWS